jgi:hypothetical protein
MRRSRYLLVFIIAAGNLSGQTPAGIANFYRSSPQSLYARAGNATAILAPHSIQFRAADGNTSAIHFSNNRAQAGFSG